MHCLFVFYLPFYAFSCGVYIYIDFLLMMCVVVVVAEREGGRVYACSFSFLLRVDSNICYIFWGRNGKPYSPFISVPFSLKLTLNTTREC